jgi:hypothetical protein
MKKTFLRIALCLTLVLSGCAQNSAPQPQSQANGQALPAQMGSSSQNTAAPVAVKANWGNLQGKIEGVYPAKGSKVLVVASQLSLYDLTTGEIVATTPKEGLDELRVIPFDGGYALVGQDALGGTTGGLVEMNESPEIRAVIYDEQLAKQEEIPLSGLVSEGEFLIDPQAIAVSPDGKSIAFATLQGLTLYNRVHKTTTRLIDLTVQDEETNLGLSVIEQLGFTNDGYTISFKAQSLDVPAVLSKPSFDTVGTVNVDGSNLINIKPEGYAPKMLISYPSKLLVAEDFKTASGRMMVMDSKSKEQKIYNLSGSQEGGNVYGSDTGRYFASSIESKDGWTVRIYDTDSGAMVKEENISNDGQDQYAMDDPMLCVLDDTKTCIVLLGRKQQAVDTKITTFSF